MSYAIQPAGLIPPQQDRPSASAPVAPSPAASSSTASSPTASKSPAVKPEVARAAREFEAIFLRQMLTTLEKSSHMGSTGSAGSDVYGSMMVGALADAVAAAGGVGLAKYVTTSLTHAPAPTETKADSQGIPLKKPQATLDQPTGTISKKGIR